MRTKRISALVCALAIAGAAVLSAPSERVNIVPVQAAGDIVETTGTKPENIIDTSTHIYDNQDKTVKGYMFENDDGTITRVEYVQSAKKIVVEIYDMDTGELVKPVREIAMTMSIFGGFYAGENYNFIVEGEANTEEDSNKGVFTVIRYTKDWSSWKSKTLNGINTQTPFAAGSCDMTENAGKLYIHTCHRMFKTSDNVNHQANMSFVLDEETMDFEGKYTAVSNNPVFGYVSHSFDQRAITDGEKLYIYDHGDAYPRALVLKSYDLTSKRLKTTNMITVLGGFGDNYTSVTTGGIADSADNIIVGVKMADPTGSIDGYQDLKDIYLLITPKASIGESGVTKTVKLTDYAGKTGLDFNRNSAPQIVKINDDKFIVMWKESTGSLSWWSATDTPVRTKIAVIDGSGNVKGDIISTSEVTLSDCEPILCSDGMVRWYANVGNKMKMFILDPDDPSDFSGRSGGEDDKRVPGDVDLDNEVDIDDVLLIQQHIAKWDVDIELANADVNGDDSVDIDDVLLIQQYIAKWDVELK